MSEKTASEKAISEDSALGNAAVENEMGIQKARLYVTGLGVYEAYINGKKPEKISWLHFAMITGKKSSIRPTM